MLRKQHPANVASFLFAMEANGTINVQQRIMEIDCGVQPPDTIMGSGENVQSKVRKPVLSCTLVINNLKSLFFHLNQCTCTK